RGLGFMVNGTVFQISSLSFIPPQGYVQLHADEKTGPSHLEFKLPASGASIQLFDESGVLVDRVEYGPQLEGISQGRLPDGSANIVSFPSSTSPAAPNYQLTYSGTLLNEIMAHNVSAIKDPAEHFSDWIELFNPTLAPFDLSGMIIEIGESASDQWKFPAGIVIAPDAYLFVWCDPLRAGSVTFENNLNTGLRLRGEGGSVSLLDRTGQAVDAVNFGFQIADQPIGR